MEQRILRNEEKIQELERRLEARTAEQEREFEYLGRVLQLERSVDRLLTTATSNETMLQNLPTLVTQTVDAQVSRQHGILGNFISERLDSMLTKLNAMETSQSEAFRAQELDREEVRAHVAHLETQVAAVGLRFHQLDISATPHQDVERPPTSALRPTSVVDGGATPYAAPEGVFHAQREKTPGSRTLDSNKVHEQVTHHRVEPSIRSMGHIASFGSRSLTMSTERQGSSAGSHVLGPSGSGSLSASATRPLSIPSVGSSFQWSDVLQRGALHGNSVSTSMPHHTLSSISNVAPTSNVFQSTPRPLPAASHSATHSNQATHSKQTRGMHVAQPQPYVSTMPPAPKSAQSHHTATFAASTVSSAGSRKHSAWSRDNSPISPLPSEYAESQ